MISKINLQGTENYKITYDNGNVSTVAINTTGAVIDEVNEAKAGDTEKYPTAIAVEPEFTEAEQLKKDQSDFRADRDKLINQADIEIYKLEDNGQDTTTYRTYRQALRDSTINWVLPTKP